MAGQPQQLDYGKNRSGNRRIGRARNLNVAILLLAIGLAVLDLTGFTRAGDALPSAARAAAAPAVAATPTRHAKLALAALSPTRPEAPLTGW
ncbi:MAG TPA: hypothetical protein VKQ73_08040 [Stellaceae bacterium]|nr:hypothetical protein [Stellaceae bacterium]